ncbi:hypothetical protein MHU86_1188 [Fragilaria crotonensis]|nr:hypothetical protein MHU86_1188 [Fragilaria crotonensis]
MQSPSNPTSHAFRSASADDAIITSKATKKKWFFRSLVMYAVMLGPTPAERGFRIGSGAHRSQVCRSPIEVVYSKVLSSGFASSLYGSQFHDENNYRPNLQGLVVNASETDLLH